MGRLKLTLCLAAVSLALVLPALASRASPVSADGPPEVATIEIVVPDLFNPCTGALHTHFATMTIRNHEFELTDPERHHFNTHVAIDVATSDGFSGSANLSDIDNGFGLFGAETTGVASFTQNFKIRNASGQIISVHGNFHVTVVDGELIAEVDRFSLECVGRPAP